ncbi:tyrosine-type recombinase/integrase [Paenalkalicoccus suaedae]|uniref:Tyrosine-type recombinase/integrase n=1 Tax=Paenalkalicoccus suaedae TaxID=2592382 RepID=A0A859FBD0_9BACI|nr:site-specific tyrosine recombinase/integron integrase [Paenalkalicoccus suaedae]QKS70270.1 tyrosine-type recombinase/integrase [Paenalkalicoccus suaedae]
MNINGVSAGELMISEVTGFISELLPINVDEIKEKLSHITNKYHITRVPETEVHPDLDEKIQLFLASKGIEGLSVNSLSNYELQLRKFKEHVKKRTDNITAADIRVYLGSFKTAKPSTIETKLSVLKSFFGWLHNEEILQRDPSRKIKSPKKAKRVPKALKIEELEMLRESAETIRQRAFVEVLYATGCRLSEIHDMNIDHINTQDMSAYVVGKGDKERKVYFSFRALYHLKKYLKQRTDEDKALFVTERKPYKRLSKRAVQQEIKKIAIQAGLEKKVSPHTLRHTFATLLLNNGAELAGVQALLGHQSPETTLIYSQLSDQKKQEQHKRYLVQ